MAYEPNNETDFGVSIASMCNTIVSNVNSIVSPLNGICIVAENLDDKKLVGFNNTIGPKVLVTFIGEESLGGDDVSELLGWTKRHFDILIQRGRLMCDPLTTALTQQVGPVMPFYDMLESIRDIVRSIEWPQQLCQNPSEYHGMEPMRSENWLMDSYIIHISVNVQIGRIETPDINNS